MLSVGILDRSYANYQSAMYQLDFHQSLQRACNVRFRDVENPSHLPYNLHDSDVIIYGYWFFEFFQKNPCVGLRLIEEYKHHSCKIFILNKEYVFLEQKVELIRLIKPHYVLSHHHAVDHIVKDCNTQTIFSPFGYNPEHFYSDNKESKDIDLFFSGMMSNPNQGKFMPPSDFGFRADLLKHFVKFCGTVPLYYRRAEQNINAFINVISSTPLERKVSRFLRRSNYLELDYYSSLIRRSCHVLCSLSPSSLVSTRFFESIASGAKPICKNSDIYEKHGIAEFIIQVSSVTEALEVLKSGSEITRPSHTELLDFTWHARVESILSRVR